MDQEVKAPTDKERIRGGMFGMAVGDAFGTTLEFQKGPTLTEGAKEQTDIIGGGPFFLLPGQWTDDTSMGLCLAESLIETRGFNPKDQLSRYLEWYREGKLSANGQCFDIGIATRMALMKYEQTNEEYPASSDENSRAGNGSLMRLCPVPFFYVKNPSLAIEKSAESSRTTHGSKIAVDACRYFAALLMGIFRGASKEELLSERYVPPSVSKDYWTLLPLCPEIDEIARGSFKIKNPPEIEGKGYVAKTLESVLWAFYHTDSFEKGLIKVVNLGDDADTTGAIYGQLAGTFYGEEGIPQKWRDIVFFKSLISAFANEIFRLSEMKLWEMENSSSVELSKEYQDTQKCFRMLETNYKSILKRVLPGPNAYKKIGDFDKDVQELISKYSEDKDIECSAKQSLLADFQKLFENERKTLEKKLSRPVNPFASMIPKP